MAGAEMLKGARRAAATAGAPARVQEAESPRPHIEIIGRSHIVALRHAYDERRGGGILHCGFLNTANLEPLASGGPGSAMKDDAAAALRAAMEKSTLACLMIHGNQHQSLGLIRHEPPLDVVTRHAPELPLAPGAQLVPERAVIERFESTMGDLKLILGLAPGGRLLVMGPPPPIEDSAYIAERFDPVFTAKLEQEGRRADAACVADPLVRWKLWRILEDCFERVARAHAATWLPVPPEAVAKGRYLHPKAYGTDSTHANAWYGELRLQQIEALL